jgi:hypothetical protein
MPIPEQPAPSRAPESNQEADLPAAPSTGESSEEISSSALLLRRFGGLGAAATFVAIAMIRAATAAVPADSPPASDATKRAAFADMANDEASERTEAAHAFPGDLWSQDDDFHGKEQKRARTVASKRNMRLGDVLDAVDEGMRDGWPPLPRVTMKPGVVPCRPRLSY